MKKIILNKPGRRFSNYYFFIALLILGTNLNAQISETGYPVSYHAPGLKNTVQIPEYNTKVLDKKQLLTEDKEFPTPYRHSKFDIVTINIITEGIITEMKDFDGKIWRYKVSSSSAKALQVKFDKFYIPEGAKLFVYNPDYTEILGAFTSKNNKPDSTLTIANLNSKDLIIEYFEPFDREFEGKLVIGSIGQAYKNIFISNSEDANGYIGVNCPEGEKWQNQKHAVCLITFQIGEDGYSCSGSLINNVREDGTPYFLTANHCISDKDVARTVIAYFNYEQMGCNGTMSKSKYSLSGAQLVSTGIESDFSLLLFDTIPPNKYKPFYAGWDASGSSGSSAVGIHHPNGNPKKISIENDAPVSYAKSIQWDNDVITPQNSHWEVIFDAGRTYSGSSGSPLFNSDSLIIGQLHGGGNLNNYYGKLNYSWTRKSDGFETLESYLDPDQSGTKTLNGYYPSGLLPDPQLITEFNPVCKNAQVRLKAVSAFDPTSWTWNISPSSFTYVEGTNSESQNPIVLFTEDKSYNIELTATNVAGSEVIDINNALVVDSNLNIQALPVSYNDSCVSNFTSLTLKAYGANDFIWSINNKSEDIFYVEDSTSNPAVIKAYNSLPSSSTEINYTVSGNHGTCTAVKSVSFPLISQENDNVASAIQIHPGQNGIFTNKCAGIQDFEPVPPFTSCTGQNSWCNEFGTGKNIVANSVWFYFIAESNKDMEISSKGMDNQVAVYEAESAFDLLAGKYTLIGANDDYKVDDPNPFIETLKVKTGKKYWVQVDGSGGNIEGSFYLYLGESTLSTKNLSNSLNNIKIYPQPATDMIEIDCGSYAEAEEISLHVINSAGIKIYNQEFMLNGKSKISLEVSDWESGIYIVQLVVNKQLLSSKLIIE